MIDKKEIFVTQPYLPPLEEFIPYLQDIWQSRQLTNNGKYHQMLETALCEYLGVPYVSLFANGTLALITALQTLRITGEVITTPFSFVATTHALHWNGIKPVFADIEHGDCNISPSKIEAAISPQTTAIMPVHVYGNPCMTEEIQKIADTYGLKVIYDAAHAFGVKRNGVSVLNAGDLSVLSFHATKVFNTFEGGAIVCHDEKTKQRIDFLKNFGFADEVTVVAPGINAKMNEVQAAMGLLQLKHIDELIGARKKVAEGYKNALSHIRGLRFFEEAESITYNYAYFPVFIEKEIFGVSRDEVYAALKKEGIYTRRYFYPLISHFSTYKGLPSSDPNNLMVAENMAEQVLCLPIYPELEDHHIQNILNIFV